MIRSYNRGKARLSELEFSLDGKVVDMGFICYKNFILAEKHKP